MARFREDQSVILGYVDDLYALLRAIDEAMPQGTILYVEGTSVVPEIGEFLVSHAAPETLAIAANTFWPTPDIFRMPLSGTNMADLRALADRHAEPEICDHVAVYRGDELLLWAHDAGDGWLQVGRSLPEETVDGLRKALGTALQPPPRDMSGV